MARDEMAREHESETSLLDRRSYLKLAGAAAASLGTVGTSGAAAAADGDGGLILREEYEDETYRDNYTKIRTPEDEHMLDECTTKVVRTDSQALRVRFPKGSHDGMTAQTDPVEAGLVEEPVQELYASYWLYFPEDFECANGEGKKLPGPVNYFEDHSATDENGDGHGGDTSTGYGWSARLYFGDDTNDAVNVHYGTYHMDMETSWGEPYGETYISKGQWHLVQQHINLNTTSGGSADSNGVLELWIDGKNVFSRDDFRFTDYPEEGIKYNHTTWYGGSTPSPKDQSVYLDEMALHTNQLPEVREPSGDVFELVSNEETSSMDYEFTVEGNVHKRRYAGDISSEENDTLTDNDDGTTTVSGTAGNGYGDSYIVDGVIRSMTIDESKWTLRYADEEVTVDDLVEPVGPDVDRFNVTKSEQLGEDRMFSVQWAVSDVENGLETVEVVVVENTADVNFAVTNVAGESASGWDLFQFPIGTELDVTLRVTDAAENATKQSKTITL